MAGNDWINGYLEAILDAGSKLPPRRSTLLALPSFNSFEEAAALAPRYSPAKYFVEEVVSRFDDADLHKTWTKMVATRNSQERNNRLENMCWRIWHLARKKKQIELEDARRLLKRRLEREQGIKDAAEDVSELSEGEREKSDTPLDGSMVRHNSDMKIWSDGEVKSKRLYIVLISLHGLVRGENMELGRDSDTGGQVKYVVELARALAATEGVYRVDLLTRQILAPDIHWTYGEPVEMLNHPTSDPDSAINNYSCGAYIIRLPCGPKDKYIAKESLWPHIPEFVDRAVAHIADVARSLGDHPDAGGGCGKPVWPYVIHGHYADAGDAAARISGILNVPMVLTGHSLGRNKLEQLLKQGRLGKEEINETYRIMRRIEGEEIALDAAEMVVTSTRQEIEEQWGLYDGFDVNLERKLRVRRRRGVSCLGRYMPRMVVIPPGMDFSNVNMQDHLAESENDLRLLLAADRSQSKRDLKLPPIWTEVLRFFTNPHKPMILALSRPDPKKNVTTLLKAFGECRHLRELANMTLILGNRDDIEEMSESSIVVLTNVLKLIDKYDLYGQVAYPKHHKQSDVPEIYRLAAKTKGVFINPALVEPFGLTLIEAAAYGLPVVATKNGGPVDILKTLNNGLLVDPHDHTDIANALLNLVANKNLWLDCRRSGLKNIHKFSWPEHCRSYLSHVEHCRMRHPAASLLNIACDIPHREEPLSDSLKDVVDLSLRFSLDTDAIKPNGAIDANSVEEILRRQRSERTKNNNFIVEDNRASGRRQKLLVVAADCYSADGKFTVGDLSELLDKLNIASAADGRVGFVLSTGSSVVETLEAIRACNFAVEKFDALICRSGAEICYPWRDFSADMEYGAHIECKWAAEHLKSAVLRLARADAAPSGEDDDGFVVDEKACSSNCYVYSVTVGAKVRKIDAIRQRLRMRGIRCNIVYTRACTRLNVVPMFASRALALRYLSILWGMDLSKMVVIVGDKGDTDYEELLPGLHKSLIVDRLVVHGSERLLRDQDSCKREDFVPSESPNILAFGKDFDAAEIKSALDNL